MAASELAAASGAVLADSGVVVAEAGVAEYTPCPSHGVCRILPLGDSITAGNGYEGGYRIELFRKSVAAGKWITFSGSQQNGPAIVADTGFPRHHEGRPGWRIDQLMSLIPSPALDEAPHIVLLMIGANDLGQYYDLPHAPERLATLLDRLLDGVPEALVVVASLPPFTTRLPEVLEYNEALTALVRARADAGKHIQLADMFTSFPESELGDAVHPNATGYERMAAVWYDAISSVLPELESQL